MWKIYQKWKCIKLKSVQILLKITGLAHRKSYVVIICAILSKVYQKRNFVKLKSVRTLLRIACSHMLSLFVPVHVKSIPNVKFIQILLKITSIFPNLTFEGNPRSKVIQLKIMRSTERPYTCIWLPICVSSKFWSGHAPFRRYSPLKTQLYLIWPLTVIQGQR